MEPYVLHTLQASILITWLVGLFPTKNPLFTSKNFKFGFFSAGTLLAVPPLALSCLNIFGALYSFHINLRDQHPQAYKLVVVFSTSIALTYAALARFLGVLFCSKLVSLVKLLEELRILCSKNGYLGEGRATRWKSRLTVVFCLILAFTTAGHVWVYAAAVLTGDRSNPLTALAFKNRVRPFQKFVLIFGYSNPIVTQNVLLALTLCIGNYLLRLHEQISHTLLYNLENSGRIVDYNMNGHKFCQSYMEVFGKLKACFRIYSDVLGLQSFLIIVENLALTTYCTYFILWPMDGLIHPITLPAALLTPGLMLWIGNSMENQVNADRYSL